MKKFCVLLIFLTGCANMASPTFKSLLQDQPYVTEFSPAEGSHLEDPVVLRLKFSHRIDINSLDDSSVLLVQGPVETSLLGKISNLLEAIQSQEVISVATLSVLDGDETTLEISPVFSPEPGIYQLIVTPQLRSVEKIPFNQKPGSQPTSFVATFSYGEGVSVENSDTATTGPANPEVPAYGPAPESLVLNEILYDGLTSETDGEAFAELYGTPGADIGLYQVSWINGADGQETDRVTLPKGTTIPEDGLFVIADLKTNTTSETKVANPDFLDQFDPQNGPDAVQLFDRDGGLLDSVVYGNGAVENSSTGQLLVEGSPAKDVGGGHSLSRVEGKDSDNNQTDFVDLAAPTPGVL